MTFAAYIGAGTVAAWLTVVAIVGAGWVLWRGGGGTALRTLEDANRVLVRRVEDQDGLIATLRSQVAILEAKTDVTLALAPLTQSLIDHEDRAAERFAGMMDVLGLIADRLGPDS